MKKELLALSASLVLATSLSANVRNHPTTNHGRFLSGKSTQSLQIAREAQPGDDPGKDRKDNGGKGHKFG